MAKKPRERRAEETEWLSSEEVAALLKVSPWTVFGWARDGDPRLPAYRVWDSDGSKHGRFRFKREDVEQFLAASQDQAGAAAPVPAAVTARVRPEEASERVVQE